MRSITVSRQDLIECGSYEALRASLKDMGIDFSKPYTFIEDYEKSTITYKQEEGRCP